MRDLELPSESLPPVEDIGVLWVLGLGLSVLVSGLGFLDLGLTALGLGLRAFGL